MDNIPDHKKEAHDPYQGYSAQPYGADEMPQSTYPQQNDVPYYTPGEQPYTPPQPHYVPPSSEQAYGQQQQQYYAPPQQPSGQAGSNTYQSPYRQSAPGDIGPLERTAMGMKARTAGMFCYLFGWVGGLVFLVLERENRFVRFHAMQSILFFGILGIAQGIASYLPYLDFLKSGLGIVMFIGWIFLFITANKGRYYKLPILGDLAEQLLTRFR